MVSDKAKVEGIRKLFEEAKRVHIDYERDELGGAYDEEWAKWYAMYLMEHGLPELLPTASREHVDANRLTPLLSQADEMHRANAPDSDWMPYYARFLLDRLSSGQ